MHTHRPKTTIHLGMVVMLATLWLGSCSHDEKKDAATPGEMRGGLSNEAFAALLRGVSKGWNNNDARAAADCFAEDAVYIEPPDQQRYQGREALFEFFGGEAGRASPMRMDWHYIVFDEAQQVGMGEYTFQYKGRSTHGIVIVQVAQGKIRRWREYQYRSTMAWEAFIGSSRF